MRDENDIELTPQQHARIRAVAVARGVSVEEAALLLAHKTIKQRFLLPQTNAKVVPIRALNRSSDDEK